MFPDSTAHTPQSPSFEYLQFDNQRGVGHLCGRISKTTAKTPSRIQFSSPTNPRLRNYLNASKTMGDLCDVFSVSQDAHIRVQAEQLRGTRRRLGFLTVERVGTLRPQFICEL